MDFRRFKTLHIEEVTPTGWLKKQLEIQAEGLSGKLHESWESVGAYSGWLGGTGENWERGPYYLDGILPLAYYLKDDRLFETAEKFIRWTLKSQDDDGNFGPLESKHDWWSRMVMLKVLIQYYEITHEDNVLHFMHKYYKYQLTHLRENPLEDWGKARCADLLYCIKWLYEKDPREYLKELSLLILEQGENWNCFFENLPFTYPTEYYYTWADMERFSKDSIWELMKFHQTHIVNVTMGTKYPAMASWVLDQNLSETLKKGIRNLKKYHGVVTGAINGDEHLAGNNPSRGTELCAIAEYMFSLQIILEIFGDTEFADLLERLAFNAYPAMFTEDYMAHQYLQQVNQIAATNETRPWYNNLDDSNTFGLEPNFGCCTANMHQGWPKFVRSLWYREDSGLVSMVFAPNELKTKINGEDIWIETKTQYPARLKIEYLIKQAGTIPFTLKIRIPEWCHTYEIHCNGTALQHAREDGYIKLYRRFSEKERIVVSFHAEVKTSHWYHNSISLEKGPLIFALDMDEHWHTYRSHAGIDDYEVTSQSAWNYALIAGEKITVQEMPFGKVPFEKHQPPIVIQTKAIKTDIWKQEGGNTGNLPKSPIKAEGKPETIRLIPFGCTHLRIAQFPFCNI